MSYYQPYPAYKDSEAEWLGAVPETWEVLPCRSVVDEQTRKNDGALNNDYLSLLANIGVISYADKGDVGNKKPEDLSKCKLVSKGDLVINSMNYGIGSFGLSGLDGVCSPVYIVLRSRGNLIEERFALRVFENRQFQKYAQSFGTGILDHRAAIGWDDLKGIKICLPSLAEQDAILKFVDRETARIDALVTKKTRFIELLREKRQALITHVVTKGLDPTVKLKDSGMEWLGKVPVHWEVQPFRRVIKKIEQGWSPNAASDPCEIGGWGVLKLSAIRQGGFFSRENKTLFVETDPDQSIEVKVGDLLVTRANTPQLVGDACVVTDLNGYRLMLSDLIYRIHLNPPHDPTYFCKVLISSYGRSQIEADARGSSMTMAKISQEHINAWIIPVPPLDEQKAITGFLNHRTAHIDTLISKTELSIELLKERRSALITAAVTGQIDVREAV